jgi:hypothetical protein
MSVSFGIVVIDQNKRYLGVHTAQFNNSDESAYTSTISHEPANQSKELYPSDILQTVLQIY